MLQKMVAEERCLHGVTRSYLRGLSLGLLFLTEPAIKEQEGRKVLKDTVDSKSKIGDSLGLVDEAIKMCRKV